MKQKTTSSIEWCLGFAPILILGIILIIGVIVVGAYFAGTKGLFNKSVDTASSPTPTASQTPSDVTANWKTYTNSVANFSFKYPSTWTIDTTGEKGDDQGTNIQIKLTKGQAKINISADMVGIGGVGGNYQGTPVTFAGVGLYKYKITGADDKTIIIGLTDQLTESLGIFQINGKTYNFSLEYPNAYTKVQGDDLEKEFDLILPTFKFSEQSSVQNGTVTGKLCYPSSFIPPGQIITKNTSTKKQVSQDYPGTQAGAKTSYSFTLPAGTYHFKLQLSQASGYYDSCSLNPTNDVCTVDSNHTNLDVKVNANQETKNIDLCDFYYSPTQMQSLDSTF